MNDHGADAVERRLRIAQLWQQHRARWTLPLVIIVIIAAVAIVDHLDSHQISRVDEQNTSVLVPATGGAVTVAFDRPWDGFNPNTPAGAASTSPTLLSAVLPSAYVITPQLAPQKNNALLSDVEVTSTSPLTIQYDINPSAAWSDGVPVSAADFIYAWKSQRGEGVDVNGQADQVASTLGYRDVASVTPSHGGKTVTVVFSTPFTDWRVMFNNMVPAHIAEQVGWNDGFDTFNPAVELSAGPLIIKSASSGRVVLVRNPKWWGPRSVLSRVTVTDVPTQSTWTRALAANNQTVASPSAFNLNTLNAVSSLPNTESSVKPSSELMELDFNMRASLTAQTAARQAIAHALDRPLLLNETFASMDPGLVINQDHLALPAQPDYTTSSASGEYGTRNLADTDALLRSVGYHQDPAGYYIDDSGKQLTIRMAVETGDPWIEQVGEEIVAQLNQAGIAVTTVPVDGIAGMEAAAGGVDTYDMALVTRTISPFETTTGAWYSDDLDPNDSTSTQNWSHLDDPEVNQLFVQAERELNPVAGGAIYAQIDDQLWDQMVALPLFEEPGLVANGVQVSNVEYNPSINGILWNVYLWTLLKPGTSNQ